MFDVDVKADGQVDKAKVRESMIGDREIVSCMEDALRGMSLPGVVTPLRSSEPVSEGMVSPRARAPMGNILVLGGAVSLVPIVLIAAGVTIVVAVTAHVAEEAVEAAGRRRAVQRRCQALLDECLDNVWQPEETRKIYGNKKDCRGCFMECKNHNGVWPDERCPRPN
ncbi:hypothetical protein [Polyangium sp. 6x1]|uniref:hypothetical protein n=1 Tax=Polyangium sp. 6x1 TaxID=3042689 RepID=UPI0024826DBF|nr:hypothetical protein [Polyangium sp. 6x1]MDI1442908.1 hypothetical protein [Polyangium sp. 6x1]